MRLPAPSRPSRRGLTLLTTGALLAAPLALGVAGTADAASTTVVVNEVYINGGSSGATYTNKYVELRNLTGSPIDFSATPMSVQYRAPGSSGPSTTSIALTGTIPANGYYTLQGGSNGANGIAVPGVDQSASGFNPGNAGGTVTLASGTAAVDPSASSAVVDKLGYGTSNTPETAAASGNSVTLSIQRIAPDNDNNSTEFTAQTPTPDAENVAVAPPLDAQSPGNRSGVAGAQMTPFTLTASGGTSPYTWTATGLPPGVNVAANGTVTGTPTTAGSYSVTATATDSATPTAATDSVTFTFTVIEPGTPIAISAIQGTGATTPLNGQTVTTRGVVTASYPTGGLNGFYIQTPGPDTPDASDAVFVYGGTSGFTTYPAVGDSVEVTGTAGEFASATQVSAIGVSQVTPSLGQVTPKTQVPGTDCSLPGTACLTGAALDTAREVVEGELFKPTAPWTVTDSYDGSPDLRSNGQNDSAFLGELAVVADSDDPLVAPTEIIDAQDTAAIDARKAYNAAHRLILDDASSWSYYIPGNPPNYDRAGEPLPWFTADHTARVGAGMTFVKPVVFTQRNTSWRILPQEQVVGKPTGVLEFEQTRPAAPEPVGGDIELATFNVLNFFPTTGEDYVSSGLGLCSYYTDRQGNRITTNQCGSPSTGSGNGPRGAADTANLVRQRDKIVRAINTAGADIVSLEELENSVKFDKPRDFAINELVEALNADAGAGTWAAVPSPAELPPLSEQDVIRTGFIYKPADVRPVGDSVVLTGQSSAGQPFSNARQPLAQAFTRVGASNADAFAVIVNHFKSKGSACAAGSNDPLQGNCNGDRVNQANALVAFADQFKAARHISKVFLAGDFNAYSQEDPIQVLEAAGYTNLESTSDPQEESYSFDGMVGSLDHVLANNAALATVAGVDIWDINSYESVYYEYSRFNSNVTNLYAPNPYRSSDHNPEIVGIKAPVPAPVVVDTTVTGTATPVVYGKAGAVAVKVAPATATGTVTLSLGGVAIGTTTLAAGAGTIAVPAKALPAGSYTLALSYGGDAGHKASTGTVTYVVQKATPTLMAKVKPRVFVKGKKRPKVIVRIEADGYTPTGKVRIRVAGKVYRAPLVDGKAVVKIKKITKPRRYKAKVRYLGDANTEAARTTVRFRVRRR